MLGLKVLASLQEHSGGVCDIGALGSEMEFGFIQAAWSDRPFPHRWAVARAEVVVAAWCVLLSFWR